MAFHRELSQAVARLGRELQAAHPEFARFKFNADVRTYRKPPRDFSKHPQRIVTGFLINQQFLAMTNEQVVAQVAGWFPGYQPSQSIMTRPLHPSARKAIQAMVATAALPLTVRPSDTLSTLKKAIRAKGRAENAKAGILAIELAEGYVTINSRPYRIDPSRNDPSIRVDVGGNRRYLRCDVLQALLNMK